LNASPHVSGTGSVAGTVGVISTSPACVARRAVREASSLSTPQVMLRKTVSQRNSPRRPPIERGTIETLFGPA